MIQMLQVLASKCKRTSLHFYQLRPTLLASHWFKNDVNDLPHLRFLVKISLLTVTGRAEDVAEITMDSMMTHLTIGERQVRKLLHFTPRMLCKKHI